MPNMELIQTVTVGAGGAATIDFTSIPQTYTDLVIKLSSNASASTPRVRFNSSSSSIYKEKLLYGQGNSAAGTSASSNTWFEWIALGNYSASNFFGNCEFYIPNYTGANNKTILSDGITEVNATSGNNIYLDAGLWSSGSAISVIQLYQSSGVFNQYTTAYLYGVTNVLTGPKATGGNITFDSSYYYHTFLSSGTFTPTQSLTCDYLVVAGGGSGGARVGGGGGAGGLRSTVIKTGGGGSLESPISVTAQAYTITIGAGGASVTNPSGSGRRGNVGTNSEITGSGLTTITSTGGGGGGGYTNVPPLDGYASGGGGQGYNDPAAGGTGISGQGYAGGVGKNAAAGGGGGAGSVGVQGLTAGTAIGGAGGVGVQTGMPNNTPAYYAGGGGGSGDAVGGQGGNGGGGNAASGENNNAQSAVANTGGGGGGTRDQADAGGFTSGSGGSGIIVIRYAK